MSIQHCFEKFYETIKLTSAQEEDAEKKYNGVCKTLHDFYYPNSEYDGTTKLLIGSFGKGTNIRPPRDVDVLFIMPSDKFDQYNDNRSNSQSQLLQDIKKVLSKRYSTTDKIKGWGKVVFIKFAEGTHNIELLPAWEQISGDFIIPNSENGGRWETWDPRYEINNINVSDKKTKGKTRALIRMIKKWSENCTVNLKSFQIEKKVVEFFAVNDANKAYSILVKDFFIYFYSSADNEIISYLNTAKNRAIKACELESSGSLEDTVDEWKKLFGSDFPSLEDSCIGHEKDKPVLADYSHCEPLRWPLNNIYRVNIDAYIFTKENGKQLGGINSDGRILSPGLYLKFVARSNAKGSFRYFWQVVNTGQAARENNDLRGNIFKDRQVHWESTRYNGKHWIECFIVQDECCVARSGKFFINIR